MTNLTKFEIQVLTNALNYKTRDDQLCDNFSDSCIADDARSLGVSTSVINGVYVSLWNKGLGHVVREKDTDFETYFQLSTEGVNVIFDHIEKIESEYND